MKLFKNAEEFEENKKRYSRNTAIITVVLIAAFIVGTTFFDIAIGFTMFTYNKRIGAHLQNAYDGSTPELMKEELIAARQAMISEGLKRTDYGMFFWWEQTDEFKMDYTYRYIDGLINRTDYIIQWRDTYINASAATTLADVYDEMLDDLRIEYLRNGPIDWTARPAWQLKHAKWIYFQGAIGYAFWGILLILGLYRIAYRYFINSPKEISCSWYSYKELQKAYLGNE